jgi:hypothetical protein
MPILKYYDGSDWEPVASALQGPTGVTGPTGVATGLPTGGVTGAVLAKTSTTDYATEWDVLDYEGAWVSYTPTWTGISSSGATSTGAYKQIGKTVFFQAKYVTGSSGISITGAITPSLPVTKKSTSIPIISGLFVDAGTGYRPSVILDVSLYAISASTTYADAATPSNSIPFTWAVNDEVRVSGVYEAN